MRIFDCHSHWGTERGYIFRTEEQLAQQEKIWKTKATFLSDEEMVGVFPQEQRQGHPRPVVHQVPADRGNPRSITTTRSRSSAGIRTRSSVTGCSSTRAARWNRSASSTAPWRPTAASSALRQRPGDRRAGERSALGPVLPAFDRGRPADHDSHRAHRDRPGPARAATASCSTMATRGISTRSPRAIRSCEILAARPAYPWQDEMLTVLDPQAERELRAARLGAAAISAGAEEGDRRTFAGSGDVRLRFSGASIREGDRGLEIRRLFGGGPRQGAVPERRSLLRVDRHRRQPRLAVTLNVRAKRGSQG